MTGKETVSEQMPEDYLRVFLIGNKLSHVFDPIFQSYKTDYHPVTQKTALSFAANVRRVGSLAYLPGWLVSESMKWMTAFIGAIQSAGDNPTHEVVVELLKTALGEVERQRGLMAEGKLQKDMPAIDPNIFGAPLFDSLISAQTHQWRQDSLGSYYASLIIGAYTAFESLSADLWLAAANAMPLTLGKNVLSNTDDDDPAPQGERPVVTLDMLADYDFDIGLVVGDFLKETQRVRFDSFGSIDKAYRAAFRIEEDKRKRVSNDLDLIMKDGKRIKVTEAVRNLMAHRGGIVDQVFLKRIEHLDSTMAAADEGKPLPLTGTQVAELLSSTIKFSQSLLRYVDGWCKKHNDAIEAFKATRARSRVPTV